MKRALARSTWQLSSNYGRRKEILHRCQSTKILGSTDAIWRKQTQEALGSTNKGYQAHEIQAMLAWWCTNRTLESASVVWKLYDLNPDPKMLCTVLDHWRWCIKLKIRVTEDYHQVWLRWMKPSKLSEKEYSIFLSALAAGENKAEALTLANEVLLHYTQSQGTSPSSDSDTVVWNSFLSVYAKQAVGSEAGKKVVEIIRQIPNPDDRSYSIVLETIANTAHGSDEAPERATDIFVEMQPRKDREAITHAFVHLLRAHSRSKWDEGAESAMEMLQAVVKDYLQEPSASEPVPNQHAFAAVIAGFCQRADFGTAVRLLDQLRSLHQQTGGDNQFALSVRTFNKILDAAPSLEVLRSYDAPDVVSYNTVLTHLTQSKDDKASELCPMLLQEMKNRGIQPDITSYTIVLKSLTDPNKAEKILQDYMMTTGDRPTVDIFDTMMSIWVEAKDTHPEATVRVQMYFDQLRGLFISTRGHSKPTRKSYKLLLKCLNTNGPASSRVLDIMYEDYLHHRNHFAHPTRRLFHMVLNAWKQGANEYNAESTVFKVEGLIRKMQHEHRSRGWDVNPNRGTFLFLLKALVKVGTEAAAERAESTLQYMEREDDPLIKPDLICYGVVMEAWFRAGSKHALRAHALYQEIVRRWEAGEHAFKPHLFSYGIMLKVWASSSHPNAADRADEIFQQMKSRDDSDAVPGVWHVTCLMDAHAQAGNVNRVHELMESELQITPERVHFNQVLKAYANSPSKTDAPEKAASIMELMKATQRPDTISYSTFLKILQNSQRPDAYANSKQVVEGMLELARSGEASAAPSAATWTTILETLLKSSSMSNESKLLELAWMEPYIIQDDEGGEKFSATRFWVRSIRELGEKSHKP